MLTKRAQVLFDDKTWETLSLLAREKQHSVGKLIRRAVQTTYIKPYEKDQIKIAYQQILDTRTRQQDIDYKELIEYGRED